MGMEVGSQILMGEVKTLATQNRGLNADEIVELLMPRLLYVADTAPPAIRDQAQAFRLNIARLVRHYVVQAQKSQNTTVCGVLEQAGESRAAEIVRGL